MNESRGRVQQVVVVGLGRFGRSIATTLVKQGYDVLAVDRDEGVIQRIKNEVTHAVQADFYDVVVARELGLRAMDAAVMAIGGDVGSNVVGTALLLEEGVPYVIARANSPLHGLILRRVGAHRVVYPEVASGESMAHILRAPEVMEHIGLGPDTGISTIRAPEEWVDRTLAELKLPEQGPVVVVAIQRGEETLAAPAASERIRADDILAVLAHESALGRLPPHTRHSP